MTAVSFEDLLAAGYQARREHRLEDALARYGEAVRLARESGNLRGLALALKGYGQIERDQGRKEAARKCYIEAVEIYRGMDEPLPLAHTIRHVGDILRAEGEFAAAAPWYEEALEIYRAHPDAVDQLDLANAIAGFARLRMARGERDGGRALWVEARELYGAVGVNAGVAEADRVLAAG